MVKCFRLWALSARIFWEEPSLLKRGIACLLCLVLLFGLVPMGAGAVTQEEQDEICAQLRSLYRRVQRESGYWNLRGLCGLMTAYQLHLLGIDTEPLYTEMTGVKENIAMYKKEIEGKSVLIETMDKCLHNLE